MIELIVSGTIIILLGGALYETIRRRLNKLEDKVDKLLMKNGIIYKIRGNQDK